MVNKEEGCSDWRRCSRAGIFFFIYADADKFWTHWHFRKIIIINSWGKCKISKWISSYRQKKALTSREMRIKQKVRLGRSFCHEEDKCWGTQQEQCENYWNSRIKLTVKRKSDESVAESQVSRQNQKASIDHRHSLYNYIDRLCWLSNPLRVLRRTWLLWNGAHLGERWPFLVLPR